MPCTLICLTPVIIGAWPAISGCVASAVAALGFVAVSSASSAVKEEVEVETENTVEVELESSVQEGCMGRQQFTRDGITLTVKINRQGRLVVCAKGQESKEMLQQTADTFAGKIQQAYSYSKAMTQLRESKFNVVEEQLGQDGKLHLKLRRW